ncbi:DNA primase [Mariniflexile rhizosphaerae]|uniref:DNA primase n=1 Tax=unclassified Mariniflexile TaxID=2643887 RepID=UPI000E3369F0|nr:DNA primase [Mariniflexile sp. TRM1-10]AXP79210.1 DNA primase [Mariniflexile sp. TRM1-10]
MITSESIDRVLEIKVDEIIPKIWDLKKAGGNFKGKSPFNPEDRTPSFVVSPAKNIWKCFSTGNGGFGPVSYIMQKEGVEWIIAIKKVADIANITLIEEALTPEQQEENTTFETYKKMVEWANKVFLKNFNDLPVTHWAKQNLENRKFSDEIITKFGIGYASPDFHQLNKRFKEKAKVDEAVTLGLISHNPPKYFDYFIDRIIFPIQNSQGRVIGFGGRKSNDESVKQFPKYLNSPETPLYNKSKVLYGLHQSTAAIIKSNRTYLVEGYTDVMAFHNRNLENTVATCGTALDIQQCKILKRLCNHIVIVRDGDKAGLEACYRDMDLLLSCGFRVSVVELAEGEDPDSIARQYPKLQEYISNNTLDALLWKSAKVRDLCETPDDISAAAESICRSLLHISDPIKRKEYIKECGKKLKISAKDLTTKVTLFSNLQETHEKRERLSLDQELMQMQSRGFPSDGDLQQFKKDGFVYSELEKAIYFKSSNDIFFKGSNFITKPLFHIISSKDEGKRIIEFTNNINETGVVDFTNKEISSYTLFQEKIVDRYNFTFEASVSALNFKQYRNRLLYSFDKAYEFTTLGQQPEGFFAFANGVVLKDEFREVDDYGIVQVKDQEFNKEGDKIDLFYSPSCSKVNLGNRDDDDSFESVRSFVYKESPINFNQWMDLMVKIYGKKAYTGIAFSIAAVFRDIVVDQYGFFPHLFLTGQKQSGKTTFSESLTNIFTIGQKGFDLNSGSIVGFFRRVSRISNIVIALEEYHDSNIHEIKFQVLKQAYDDRARETGVASGDKKTKLDRIKSACIILSQYMSVRDDNSLSSRSITEHFMERVYSVEEKLSYAQLKQYEREGLTGMMIDILKYRESIQKELTPTINELNKSLLERFGKDEYMERMLNNFIAIMAPVKIMFSKFSFPFTWKAFYNHCIEAIQESSSMISETEGTAKFWQTLSYLVDRRIIKIDFDFKIEKKTNFKIYQGKKEGEAVYEEVVNKNADEILFLRLNKVHQDYVEAVSKRKNEEPIGESTLKGYFKSKPYFLGAIKGLQFQNGSSSCYAFNYTMMKNLNVVELERDYSAENEPPVPVNVANANSYTEAKNDDDPELEFF